MRGTVTRKALRRAAAHPNRRKSHTWHGVKLLSSRQGLYETPDGLWRIEDLEHLGWYLYGPGHNAGTSVKGPESAARIIRVAQEAEVSA